MERKAVFLDIDGTLTEAGKNEPPESAVKAVSGARKRGHFVFLCTGRNYDMLSPLLKYDFDGVIASSGGYITCGKDVIYDSPMTETQRQAVMDILQKNGIYRTVECLDGSYTDEGFKDFLRSRITEGGNSELLRWREQIEQSLHILPMKEYKGQPIYKIVIMCTSKEQLVQPQEALSQDFSFCIQDKDSNGIVNGEILSRKFDKGQAVMRVLNHLGIPVSDSIAFGDSMNDKEMMETAGISICMSNGSEELKKFADEICPSVLEDGIYHSFVKYHLIEG